jgi:hypothetical protein
MDDNADCDYDHAGRQRAEACGTNETSSCTNGDYDEYDFEPFEHHCLEAGKPGQPIESRFMLTRLIAQRFLLGHERKPLVVQRNNAPGSQNRFA